MGILRVLVLLLAACIQLHAVCGIPGFMDEDLGENTADMAKKYQNMQRTLQVSDTREKDTRKIFLLGAGMSGVMTAHVMATQEIDRDQMRDMRLYMPDQSPKLGGQYARSRWIEGELIEMGVGTAGYFTDYDVAMKQLVQELNLTMVPVSNKMGFFDGKEFAFKSANNMPWVTRGYLDLKYGLGAEKFWEALGDVQRKWAQVYDLQAKEDVFVHPDNLLEQLALQDEAKVSMATHLKKILKVKNKQLYKKLEKQIIKPMIMAAHRQGSEINAIGASMALFPLTTTMWKIKEGTQELMQRMVANKRIRYLKEHTVDGVDCVYVSVPTSHIQANMKKHAGGKKVDYSNLQDDQLELSRWRIEDGNANLDNADYMIRYNWQNKVDYDDMFSVSKGLIINVPYEKLPFAMMGEYDETDRPGSFKRIEDPDFGGWGIKMHYKHGGVFARVFKEQTIHVHAVKGTLNVATFGGDKGVGSLDTIYYTDPESDDEFTTIFKIKEGLYKTSGPQMTPERVTKLFDSGAEVVGNEHYEDPHGNLQPYKIVADYRLRKGLYNSRAFDSYIGGGIEAMAVSARNVGMFTYQDWWLNSHTTGKRGGEITESIVMGVNMAAGAGKHRQNRNEL